MRTKTISRPILLLRPIDRIGRLSRRGAEVRGGGEVALNVEGREQQEQILRDAHAAFVGAVARVQNEAGEVEVADPTTGQIVGTVRAIGPGSSSRLLPR